MPQTSLLISHFNDTAGLRKCIESILSSAEHDFEIVIFDDGSTNAEKNQLSDINQLDKRIRIIYNESNRGCGYGFDQLSREANGEILHYVGADDLVHPRRIADALEFHEANKYYGYPDEKVPLLATGYRHLDHDYKLLAKAARQTYSHEEIRSMMFFYTPIAHGTISIPRTAYNNLSPYPRHRRAGVDYLFYCKNNETLKYHYIDSNRYYIRLKLKSLTRSPNSRKEQLHSHDLGMQHLWSRVLGSVEIRDITLIRQLCISRDDHDSPDLVITSDQSQKLITLLNDFQNLNQRNRYLTQLIEGAKQAVSRYQVNYSSRYSEGRPDNIILF